MTKICRCGNVGTVLISPPHGGEIKFSCETCYVSQQAGKARRRLLESATYEHRHDRSRYGENEIRRRM